MPTITQFFVAVLVLFVLYVIIRKVIPNILWKRYYSKQGVTFAPGWSFFTDLKNFAKAAIENPTEMLVYPAMHKTYGAALPPVCGLFAGPY